MQVGWVSAVQDRGVASFRYRVEAPTAGLRAQGHAVELFDPSRADAYDVVVFSKAYSAENRAIARAVKRRGGQVIFDLCDNHFYNPFDLPKYRAARDHLTEMMAIADRVVCSTPALAAVVRQETFHAIEPVVIGDVVERYIPARRPRAADEPLRLTWFGSHGSPNAQSGMTDLLLIRKELEALAAKRPVELVVCSNNRAKYEQSIAAFDLPTRYVEWSLDDFSSVLAETDAAVLPMDINPFTACKTHNRLTTALYAGVPVVAAGIDSYQEFRSFCTLDAWSEGLDAVSSNLEAEQERARASRVVIDQHWTTENIAQQWEAAIGLASTTEAEAGSGLRLQGRLDALARGGVVSGWVRAPIAPDVRFSVVLESNGEPIAFGTADRVRQDLTGFADGVPNFGFALPIPDGVLDDPQARLSVRVRNTGWVVGSDPIVVREARAPQTAVRPEERWDVSADMAAQEMMLSDARTRRSGPERARGRARRGRLAGLVGLGGILRAGADNSLES